MGAGWPVWRMVGVGRGRGGTDRVADGEALACLVFAEVTGADGREPAVGMRDAEGTAGGVADGGAAGGAEDGGVERAAPGPGPGALVSAALWPPSITASVIATPTAASTAANMAAPERKLISSMRE